MSSKGVRPTGTDGNDFNHRQQIANLIKMSVQYKFYLKLLYTLHFFVLVALWAKVGSEVAKREFGYKSAFFERLDLPTAYPWEYVWCLSVIPIILGLASFPHNKSKWLRVSYYSHFIFGILPCSLGIGSQIPELWDYIFNMESSKTPTFKGTFPMVILWYIFFLVAFQLHAFSLWCTFYLLSMFYGQSFCGVI